MAVFIVLTATSSLLVKPVQALAEDTATGAASSLTSDVEVRDVKAGGVNNGVIGIETRGVNNGVTSPEVSVSPNNNSQTVVPFTVVYLPIKGWNEITAQRYPNLYRVVEGSAIGNLVSDNADIYESIATNDNINLYNLEQMNYREADAEIAKLLPDKLDQGVFVLVCSPSFVRQEGCASLTPVVVFGAGFSGYLTSSTTMRIGLISATDVLYFEKQLNSVDDSVVTTPTQAVSKTVFDLTGQQSGQLLKEKLAFLQHNIAICEAVAATIEPMNLMFLALFILTAILSLVLLFFEINVNPRVLTVLVPINRGFLLILLSFPIACFLMFLIPPGFYGLTDQAGGLIAVCLFWTVVLVGTALVIGSVSRWIYSLLFIFAITFSTLIIDQILGGPLTLTGYLNYAVNDGVRYYGLGNEAAALLFGSWITFSGIVVNRFANAKLLPTFKRWLFLLISAVIILICAMPSLGASFGVLVWGVMGILIAWWLFSGRPINLIFLLFTLALSLSLAIGMLFVDVNFNPYSHLYNLAPAMASGPLAVVNQIISGFLGYSFNTITYSPALTAIFIIVVIWLVILAVIKPGTYREFWARNLGFRAVYAAGLVVMLIMILLEDSGIYMPSLYLVYLLSGFIWLVCDMHTWRARTSVQSGEQITLRNLLRLAIARETYENLGQGAALAEMIDLESGSDEDKTSVGQEDGAVVSLNTDDEDKDA